MSKDAQQQISSSWPISMAIIRRWQTSTSSFFSHHPSPTSNHHYYYYYHTCMPPPPAGDHPASASASLLETSQIRCNTPLEIAAKKNSNHVCGTSVTHRLPPRVSWHSCTRALVRFSTGLPTRGAPNSPRSLLPLMAGDDDGW